MKIDSVDKLIHLSTKIELKLQITKSTLILTTFLLLVVTSLIPSSTSLKSSLNLNKKQPYRKNQLYDYPNTYEAPVSSRDMLNATYSPPLLSRSLFEENPLRRLRQKEFMSTIKYSLYQLSKGELESIFNFADLDHDDLISQNEWEAFVALFILPFEACDSNKDYLLNEEEFKGCFKADPRAKHVQFTPKFEKIKHKILMDIVSTRKNGDLNFSDYLIIRRALFGWRECQSARAHIAPSAFKCALKTAIPIKYEAKIDGDKIYRAGLKIANNKGSAELDFVGYLRILYYAYVFSILNAPENIAFLEKTQFLKAIKEDRFPTYFNEEEVEAFYQLTNFQPFQQVHPPMGFDSFCFFFSLHRLFHKYSKKKEQQIDYSELNEIIEDFLFPSAYRFAIDQSKTEFNKTQYLEVSMVLQRTRLNERDFYFSFKEKQSRKKINVTKNFDEYYMEKPANVISRYHFFLSQTSPDKFFWTKTMYYRAFIITNLFCELVSDQRFLVSVNDLLDKLPALYDTVIPPINIFQRENYLIWKHLPRHNHIDLLIFLNVENHKVKFNMHKLNQIELINETLLKIIMKDWGWNEIPDTVIDLAKRGYDPLRRRMYYVKDVMKYMLIVHSSALENYTNQNYRDLFGLDKNNDPTRRFPDFNRRHVSSHYV